MIVVIPIKNFFIFYYCESLRACWSNRSVNGYSIIQNIIVCSYFEKTGYWGIFQRKIFS